jgi:hypothetical protein
MRCAAEVQRGMIQVGSVYRSQVSIPCTCSLASRSCADRRRADYNASRVCIGAAIIGAVAIRAAGQRRQGHDYSCDQPQWQPLILGIVAPYATLRQAARSKRYRQVSILASSPNLCVLGSNPRICQVFSRAETGAGSDCIGARHHHPPDRRAVAARLAPIFSILRGRFSRLLGRRPDRADLSADGWIIGC